MTVGPPEGRVVPRRAVLRAGAALTGLAVAGTLASCSEDTAPPAAGPRPTTSAPSPDTAAVARARASATRLAASAQALAASAPELAGLLAAVVTDHRAHLSALGAALPAASSPSPSASETRAASADVRAVVGAETAAAQQALDDVPSATPGLATLLARIAAARASHADLLAAKAGLPAPAVLRILPSPAAGDPAGASTSPVPQSPAPLPGAAPVTPQPSAATPTGSASPASGTLSEAAREALAAVTAGEHAAVYAYGAVVARVAPRDRARARNAWTWHSTRRDVLEERLLAAGVQPPTAAPAYDLGAVLSASAAGTLAATVEDRLAALGARAVAATTGQDRSDAAEALVAGARRAAAWRGRSTALPG